MNIKNIINEEKNKIKKVDMNISSMEDFSELPVTLKLFFGVLIIFIIYFIANYAVLKTQDEDISKTEKEIETLMSNIDLNIASSSNYRKYKDQLSELKETFKDLQSQLPKEINMQGLLNDISNNAIGNGLEIKDIIFGEEVENELYIEQPIRIILEGTYHDLGMFTSALANTDRIITLHDFTIKPKEKENTLTTEIEAKTYKYKNIGETNNE